jgi:phosphate transport system permease protein
MKKLRNWFNKLWTSISNWVKAKLRKTSEWYNNTKFGKGHKKHRRKISDGIINGITYLFSSVGIIILLAILVFIFKNGFRTLSWDMLSGDYHAQMFNTYLVEDINFKETEYIDPQIENSYFSKKWGVSFIDTKNNEGQRVVEIAHVDKDSPLRHMVLYATNDYIEVQVGHYIEKVMYDGVDLDPDDDHTILRKDGAKEAALQFDQALVINDMVTSYAGGGIRGSIITTLYLIVLTLIIALPLGIGAAIYLNELAPQNRITSVIRSMIDMISGIPSIVFGFVGSAIFIPFMNGAIGSDGGSIASGALTLTIILLPVIIRTTEEGLRIVPASFRQASLALGATQTQTTFKVVLPNAVSGILTATLLAIGRIIGESAALIYAVGTAVKDHVAINQSSTSLAVHIWSAMAGESPNFELSSAISIVILIVVFILSTIVKLISRKLSKRMVD